ncbi:hypothetical protein CEX98_12125 [Pseudoalteromonas piscicida]|uniref:Uncharacterized protein n=1 Tax=Pseudoalteromonas piscicida TaxID=43662 RepID=A0A2A5JPY3_PSEO7|nr:hypothetical protein CEX98_12125 [Pseudoalteromonas piscicida]
MMSSNQKGITEKMKARHLSKAEKERVYGGSLGVIKDDPRSSSRPSYHLSSLPSGSRKVK